jgi:AraC family transcriptional regulator, transcriptional activator of pobA
MQNQFPAYSINELLLIQQPVHFHINRLEELPPLPPTIKSPHKHRFYELFLFKTGCAAHMVDFKEYELTDNTLFFITPGQLHFWGKTKVDTMSGYRLMFTDNFFQIRSQDNRFLFELTHFYNVSHQPFLALSPEKHRRLFTYFDLLHDTYAEAPDDESVLHALLFILLSEIRKVNVQLTPNPENVTQAEVFKKFMHLLETHYHQKWTVTDYAKALHISPRHLHRIVQNLSSQNISWLIQERKILEAKRLLHFSDLTINQIAEQLGFEDVAYFSRFFKNVGGTSPSVFKKSMSAAGMS